MQEKQLTIINKLGLHARAAAKLVARATQHASQITVIKDGNPVNAKSIMGVMMLAASKGTVITLQVDGEDEVEAIADIEELINNRFGEAE